MKGPCIWKSKMFTSCIIKSQPNVPKSFHVSYKQLQLNGLKWTLWLIKVLPTVLSNYHKEWNDSLMYILKMDTKITNCQNWI